MSLPTPIEISRKIFSVVRERVPELNLTVPEYPQFSDLPDIVPPSAPEVLNSYYRAVFRHLIEDKIEEFVANVEKVILYLQSRYKADVIQFRKAYADKIKNLNTFFANLGHTSVSGVYQRRLYDIHIGEITDYAKLYEKFIDECKSIFSKYLSDVSDAVISANELYLKIYSADFETSYKMYRQFIENVVVEYNKYVDAYKLFLAKKEVYRAVFSELIDIERRKIERLRLVIKEQELGEEQKEAINRYLQVYSKYLIELEKFGLLSFEQYEIELRRYENELRRFNTSVRYIGALSELVETSVRKFGATLDLAKAEMALKDAKIDVTQQKISAKSAELDAKEAEVRAILSEVEAKLAQYEVDIERSRLDVARYLANVERALLDYKASLASIAETMLNYEKNLPNLLGIELSTRESYLQTSIDTFVNTSKFSYTVEELTKALMDATRIAASVVREYNRTVAIACSNVTAEIIREYR